MSIVSEETQVVALIREGSVIDHIPAGYAIKIYQLLNLEAHTQRITMGIHYSSSTSGEKDLIKIEGRELTLEEGNQVAIIAPDAIINIVKNYSVVNKFQVSLPKSMTKLMICPNTQCITNNDRVDTRFTIEQDVYGVNLSCHYCGKQFKKDEIKGFKLL
jgi:aspartate carbamoyltransferase regulatory subunit